MTVIDSATKHFREICEVAKSIAIEEWKDETGAPVKIYYKPTTISEAKKIERLAKGDPIERAVQFVLLKAVDESGKRVFRDEDKIKLLTEVDTEIVVRIARAIGSGAVEEENEGE